MTGMHFLGAIAARRHRPRLLMWLFACASLLWSGALPGQTVAVRHAEGLVHGFLILRTLDGTALADGDLIQTARGDRVTSRLVFHFKDGSIHDETAVYSQRQRFRLITDHLVQKGPTFPQPLDMSIDGSSGRVTVRYTDEDGKQKVETERIDVPPDLANGLILTLSEERSTRCSAEDRLARRGDAKTAARETGHHRRRRRTFLDWRRWPQSDALCAESGNRRDLRPSRAAARQATARFPRVDSWR